MIMINRKYPLQINKLKASKFKIPQQYLAGTSDHHNHNNLVCKKETVSWWAEHSPIPEEGQIKTIDLLYHKHREETKEYFSIDWSKSHQIRKSDHEQTSNNNPDTNSSST